MSTELEKLRALRARVKQYKRAHALCYPLNTIDDPPVNGGNVTAARLSEIRNNLFAEVDDV